MTNKIYVFNSKVTKVREGSDSCRLTLPIEVAQILDVEIGDSVRFEVEINKETKDFEVKLFKGGELLL